MKIRNRNLIYKLYFKLLDFYILLAYKLLKIKISLVYDDFSNRYLPKISKFKFTSKIGLIVQGPIIRDVTFKILEFYRLIYPDLKIILSSTDQITSTEVELLKKNNILFIYSQNVGVNFSNIINQSNTCLNAAKIFKELNISFILKTRSDQKLTNPEFLVNIYNHFLAFSDNKSKILFTSFGTHRYWPYDLSDFIIFSETDTFIKFVELSNSDKEMLQNSDYINKKKNEIKNAKTNFEWSKIVGGGSFFMRSYLKKKYQIQIDDNLDTYYKFLKSDFIVIDNQNLGIQWFKYNNLLHRDSENNYFSEKDYELTFLFWYCLYKDITIEKNSKNLNQKVDYS